MPKPLQYKSGDHWVECQRCAFVYRASRMKREWTGLTVCSECWEPRHPQEFVRAKQEETAPEGLVNPESEPKYR